MDYVMVCDRCPNAAVNHPRHGLPLHLYNPDAPEFAIPLWQEDEHLPGEILWKGAIPEGYLEQVNYPVPAQLIFFV